MLQTATAASVEWDAGKKQWRVRIQFGDEVIKRPLEDCKRDAAEETLRTRAIETAKDEGYAVEAAQIAVVR